MFGDFHCDWRGLGKQCRFCFHDTAEAYLADIFAKAQVRGYLCAPLTSRQRLVDHSSLKAKDRDQTVALDSNDNLVGRDSIAEYDQESSREDDVEGGNDWAKTLHSQDVLRGEIYMRVPARILRVSARNGGCRVKYSAAHAGHASGYRNPPEGLSRFQQVGQQICVKRKTH